MNWLAGWRIINTPRQPYHSGNLISEKTPSATQYDLLHTHEVRMYASTMPFLPHFLNAQPMYEPFVTRFRRNRNGRVFIHRSNQTAGHGMTGMLSAPAAGEAGVKEICNHLSLAVPCRMLWDISSKLCWEQSVKAQEQSKEVKEARLYCVLAKKKFSDA